MQNNKTISISGIDGSGKTSIIDGVISYLENNGSSARYIWLRYNHYLTKFLLVFCRLIGLTRYEVVDGVRVGYHDFYKSKLVSYLFIFLTYIDTLFTTIILVYVPRIFSDRVVICDRWVLDILIDLEIDTRLDLSHGFISNMFFRLIPDDAQCFIVWRDYESVLKARDDHEIDKNFRRRYELYYSKQYSRYQLIDNTGTLDDAINSAVSMVSEYG